MYGVKHSIYDLCMVQLELLPLLVKENKLMLLQ